MTRQPKRARRKRVQARLTAAESKMLRLVGRYVRALSGERSVDAQIRYLIRNWSKWNA